MVKLRVTFASTVYFLVASFLILASLGTEVVAGCFVAMRINLQQLLFNIEDKRIEVEARIDQERKIWFSASKGGVFVGLRCDAYNNVYLIIDIYRKSWKKMSFSYMFKFIIIGDTGVGKSCLLLQFIDHRFRQKHQVTIGVEFGAKMITVGEKTIKLQIWDTAGQESFKSITRGYYRSAAGAILVYDITNRQSFTNVSRWLEEAKINGNSEMCFVIVGNKCDMQSERKVTNEEGAKFAKDNNLLFLQVSAKTAYQVEEAFKKNAQLLLQKIQKGSINIQSEPPGIKKGNVVETKIKLDTSSEGSKPQKKKCC